ncbi:MAG: hypothetical protein A2Z08_11810 [Deltaproteobacteria bacterium RBG_16_54_11]|jgi:Arc/MetJ-type ribon-helix-helix transcriptional regulator|nr:MAG: hypothetical protein A2Z08_11810 [Deltaproteobacteria bacterium RBG_16_54_11]
MKSVRVELPDKLAAELDILVKKGWFQNQDEVVRVALGDFIHRYRFELLERFQREDIAWAIQQKTAKK